MIRWFGLPVGVQNFRKLRLKTTTPWFNSADFKTIMRALLSFVFVSTILLLLCFSTLVKLNVTAFCSSNCLLIYLLRHRLEIYANIQVLSRNRYKAWTGIKILFCQILFIPDQMVFLKRGTWPEGFGTPWRDLGIQLCFISVMSLHVTKSSLSSLKKILTTETPLKW